MFYIHFLFFIKLIIHSVPSTICIYAIEMKQKRNRYSFAHSNFDFGKFKSIEHLHMVCLSYIWCCCSCCSRWSVMENIIHTFKNKENKFYRIKATTGVDKSSFWTKILTKQMPFWLSKQFLEKLTNIQSKSEAKTRSISCSAKTVGFIIKPGTKLKSTWKIRWIREIWKKYNNIFFEKMKFKNENGSPKSLRTQQC